MTFDHSSENFKQETVSTNQPQDFHARRTALDIQQSFAVTAPAGSGKTGLLTQRLIKLITHCASPEEVLAITFTRKAAGEMQDRVLKALWHAKENPHFDQLEKNNPHDLLTWQLARELLAQNEKLEWHLLESPQRLRIQTIDSLCARISQQLPLANGIGGQLQTSDQAESLYREAIHQLFDELEEDTESQVSQDLVTLLKHFDNNFQTLENLLSELLANRDQWLSILIAAQHSQARDYLESVLKNVIDQHLKKLRDSLKIFGSELCLIIDWATQNLIQSNPESPLTSLAKLTDLPDANYSQLSYWKLLSDFLLTNDGSFRKSLTKNQGFPAKTENKASDEYKKRLIEWISEIQTRDSSIEQQLAEVRILPYSEYNAVQWNTLDALTRLLPRLAARLDVVFASHGEADFIAMSQAALKALGDEETPSDFALQLDYQIKHILVDEFQDTSLPQLQLLERLTSGWQKGDGRTLFIVGDGMQSCYSFRNAKVGLFLQARKSGIGSVALTPLDLTLNFRSQAAIVDWVNHTFAQAFPSENDINRGAVAYSTSQAFKPALNTQAVSLLISGYLKADKKNNSDEAGNENNSSSEDQKYLAELREADAVADLIQQLRINHPQESVALLARNRNQLPLIFSAMHARNLKWQSTDIDSLAERPVIVDLLSLVRAYLKWDDRIAWLSILRAPWCGLSLVDLHCVARADFNLTSTENTKVSFLPIWTNLLRASEIARLEIYAKNSINRLVAAFKPAIENRGRKSLRQTIEGIWLSLGGPATLNSLDEIQDVENFFACIEKFDRGGRIEDWSSFDSAIKKLYATPRSDADPKLQVMTIHKSKGLEFDHVIIPCLHKSQTSDKNKLLLWREYIQDSHNTQLLISPVSATGNEKDALYDYLKSENKLQQTYESTRLFYVGCTRAIKQLYLFASLAQDESGIWKEPSSGSLLNCIWQTTKAEATKIAEKASAVTHTNQSQDKPLVKPLTRFAENWTPPQLTTIDLLKKYRGHEFDDEENIPSTETSQEKFNRVAGIVIHSALEQLASHALPDKSAQWIEKQKPFWSIALNEEGLTKEWIPAALKRIETAIHNALTDPKGLWLLNASHTESACELSMLTSQETNNELKLREHIIDRTFIDQGVRWIIDYKTSEPGQNQSLNNFLQQELEAYIPQLQRYRECFSEQPNQIVKLALYFPLVPAWVEV